MTYEQLAARVTAEGETAGRRYALLVPVWEEAGELSLLFEVRSPSLHTQPGEVCFPGGGAEPGEGPQRTALRETAEELGLVPPMVELGPALPPVRRRAGEQIYPFLGRLCPGWREGLSLGKDEVAEVFSVPLSFSGTPRRRCTAVSGWVTPRATPGSGGRPQCSFGPGRARSSGALPLGWSKVWWTCCEGRGGAVGALFLPLE